MGLVLTLQELMKEPQSVLLLHRADLDPVREVVHCWVRITLVPHLGLENLYIKSTLSISDVRLDDIVIELLEVVQVVGLDAFLAHD